MERLDTALAGLTVPVPAGLAVQVRQRLPRPSLPLVSVPGLGSLLALGIFLGGSLTGTLYWVSG